VESFEHSHPFRISDELVAREFCDPLFREIIDHKRFQRLKCVRFLGAIDYIFRPNGKPLSVRHTRYDHSLGVALLALRFSRDVGWDASTIRSFVAAALLHDIGHAPLSHSLEPVFDRQFGINHHVAATAILLDGVEGEVPLATILSRFKIDALQVLDMMSNKEGKWAPFFRGKFNLDTLDGIHRCATYIHREPSQFPPYVVLLTSHIRPPGFQKVLDAFWSLKDLIYSKIINGPVGVFADRNAQTYMEKHLPSFLPSHFYMSETELRRIHPRLFRALKSPRWDRITLASRRFRIDSEKIDDNQRYTEAKEQITFDFLRRNDLNVWKEPVRAKLFNNSAKISGDP
jgi:hypothetical protein